MRTNGIAVRTENELSDRLQLLLEILHAHGELCERHERGVAHDHARALSRLLSLKKRQMQGVIRGSDVRSYLLYIFREKIVVVFLNKIFTINILCKSFPE